MMKKVIAIAIFCVLTDAFIVANARLFASKPPELTSPVVLSAETQSIPQKTFGRLLAEINLTKVLAQAMPTPKPALTPVQPEMKIALLGDSMIQTMGSADYLKSLLDNQPICHPERSEGSQWDSSPANGRVQNDNDCVKYHVTIINAGVGATNIKQGDERLPDVLAQKPDIVVVESFAYNHGTITEEEHRNTLKKIVDTIIKANKKVIILATIAPNSQTYGLGIPGLTWTAEDRYFGAQRIKLFLQKTIEYANKNNLPLADAYSASLDTNGEGKTIYIDKTTNIHPSELGYELVSQKLAEAIFRCLTK